MARHREPHHHHDEDYDDEFAGDDDDSPNSILFSGVLVVSWSKSDHLLLINPLIICESRFIHLWSWGFDDWGGTGNHLFKLHHLVITARRSNRKTVQAYVHNICTNLCCCSIAQMYLMQVQDSDYFFHISVDINISPVVNIYIECSNFRTIQTMQFFAQRID